MGQDNVLAYDRWNGQPYLGYDDGFNNYLKQKSHLMADKMK